MACVCKHKENSKITRDERKYPEAYDCGFEVESDIIYDSESSEEEENVSGSESGICRVFVDGNEADYAVCDDEDTLLERVWWLSKPPKIPRRTCVVPARRIQVMKERLLSTINPLPTLSETMRDRGMKDSTRRKIVKSDVEYLKVNAFEWKKKGSCQDESFNIIPECARTLDEIL